MSEEKRTRLEEKWESQLADNADGDLEPETEGEPGDGHSAARDLEVKDAEIARLTDQLLRQRAELANFRRRVERDQADGLRDTKVGLVRQMVPLLDDFERAVGASGENLEAYREGVELILRSFRDVLKSFGVARLAPRGMPFDPELHEAVDRVETRVVPEGHVAEVFQVGYQLDGRLVRPATVSVAAAPASDAPDDDRAGDDASAEG